jgi:hypothetical protein
MPKEELNKTPKEEPDETPKEKIIETLDKDKTQIDISGSQ